MSKLLQAMLFPFMHKFHFGDGDAPAAEAPATEPSVAPESTETPSDEPANEEAVAPKTYTEDEVKALKDAEAAKIRNKYERKLEKARMESEALAKARQEVAAAQPEPEDDAPKEQDFADYGEYLRAAARYEAKQALAEERQLERERENHSRQQSESERKRELEEDLTEKGAQKYSDFDDVVEQTGDYLKSKNLKFSQAMFSSLLEADNKEDIVYHLGKNLEDAARIAQLPAYAQAKEIGKLEAKLVEKKPVKTSNAPEPAKPIEGGKNLTKRLEDMTYEEMVEHDRKRGARYLS